MYFTCLVTICMVSISIYKCARATLIKDLTCDKATFRAPSDIEVETTLKCAGSTKKKQKFNKKCVLFPVVNLDSQATLMSYTSEDVKAVLGLFNRTPENVQQDVDIIKNWLVMQKHIPIQPSDRQIVSFLVMNKFSIEKTKEKLDMNYTMRALLPEYYKGRHPTSQEIRSIYGVAHFFPLPNLTRERNRIFICRPVYQNPEKFNTDHFFSLVFIMQEIKTLLDFNKSDDYVVDFDGTTLSTVSKIGPMDVKKALTIIEKVYSSRINAIHYLHLPTYAESLIAVVKAFLPAKIKDRIYIHKNVESLQKVYGKELLPVDYGGNLESIDKMRVKWQNLLEQYDSHFKVVQNVTVEESLRPSKLKDDELLGFHGSFRKLQVD